MSATTDTIKHLPSEAARIMKLSKKPTRAEYDDVTRVTGIGVVILGAISLVMLLVRAFLEGKFA